MTLSAGLAFVDHRYRYLNEFRNYVSTIVQPLHYATKLPVDAARLVYDYLRDRNDLLRENRRLQRQNLQISQKSMQVLSLEHENRRLRDLLQSPRGEIRRKILVAELIGIDPAPLEQKIIIDKGEHHGVYLNQPVLDANGIIGQVSMVTPFHATVTLISNPGHALLGQINRSSIRVLVTGTGDSERLELHHVSASADVRKGDRIIASGLGGRFPAGYPVATVTRVEKETGDIFATIYAKPAANLGYSHQMLLVWPDENGGGAGEE